MGGFWGGLKDFGEDIAAQSPAGREAMDAAGVVYPNAQNTQNGLMGSVIGRYKRANSINMPDSMSGGMPEGAMPPPIQTPQTPMPEPVVGPAPGADTAVNEAKAGSMMSDPNVRTQWNTDSSGGGGGLGGLAALAAARGSIVTQPTIAKVGEKGPEMIVPLSARPNNRIQPDVLEGQVPTPTAPGIKYHRYKSYINRAL